MRLDGATIAIEPRSVGACIDLAVRFIGAHLWQILGLTLVFGTPPSMLTYWLVKNVELGLGTGLALVYFLSPYLGAALVSGAGHRAFGDEFTVWGTIRWLWPHTARLLFALGLVRFVTALAGLFCFVPAVVVAVRYGFVAEILVLEQSAGMRFEQRTGELMRGTFFDQALRYIIITSFSLCLLVSVFSLIDLTSGIVFGVPILVGRVSSEFFADDLQYLIFHDPLVVTVLCATTWIIYPVGRLAWFLCYLDNRIRKEAWDIELDFRIEAQRLGAVEGGAA